MAQFIMNVSDSEKEAFMEAARTADRNASQLVREFMREYVSRQRYEAYVRAEVERGLADIANGEVMDEETGNREIADMLASMRKA